MKSGWSSLSFSIEALDFFFLSAAVRFGIGDEKKLKEKEQQ